MTSFNPNSIFTLLGPNTAVNRVISLENTDSTNEFLKRLVKTGDPKPTEITAVLAGFQSAGKGRYDRKWHSPPGDGLYMSVMFEPASRGVEPRLFTAIPLVSALAVAECIHASAPSIEPRIKYPNDIMINGNKIAGILVEQVNRPDEAGPVLVVGIGINVNTAVFPRELAQSATSILIESGLRTDTGAFSAGILSALEIRYAEFCSDSAGRDAIHELLKSFSETLGKRVRVVTGQGGDLDSAPAGATDTASTVIEGRAVDIDSTGALILETDAGTKIIYSGDIHHLRDA